MGFFINRKFRNIRFFKKGLFLLFVSILFLFFVAESDAADNGHYLIDFGDNAFNTTDTGWNNISDLHSGDSTTHFPLIDSDGSSTSVTIHFTTPFTGTSNLSGTLSSSLYPASATRDSRFISRDNFSGSGVSALFEIENLDNDRTYDFVFYASRTSCGGVNRTTDYTINSTTASLDACDNVDNTAVINNVSPSSGKITISVTVNPASSNFGYLGVLDITKDAPANVPPTANAGSNQSITLPTHSVTLSGSGVDSDGTIASYAWTETTSNGATISSSTSSSTVVTDLPSGTSTFRLTVTDNSGATATDDVDVVVSTASGVGSNPKTIVVLGSSTAAGSGASPISNSWVNLYTSYLQTLNVSSTVVNLGVSGYTTYHILATGTTPPPGRPSVDTAKNITTALTYSPDAIIVNMPSNDASNGYPTSETEANYTTLEGIASAASVPIWIATTQPRNLDASGRASLITVRDWTLANSTHPIDFWTNLANEDGTVNASYDSGDGVHLNNAGHRKLYNRVVGSGLIESITQHTIGGNVSGSSGSLVLQNNLGDNLTVSGNASFTFGTSIREGSSYSVTILTQPAGQSCAVSNGSGSVGESNITNVSVSCVNVPTAPTISCSASGQGGAIWISWVTPSGVKSSGATYEGQYHSGSSLTWDGVSNVSFGTTWLTADVGSFNQQLVTGLTPNIQYTFRMHSLGELSTESSDSNAVTCYAPGSAGSSVKDLITPTSYVTLPTSNSSILPGNNVVIKGTAQDSGGSSVQKVEISVDGGINWNLTNVKGGDTGTNVTWEYTWNKPATGTYIIKTRAYDWMGNMEISGEGIRVVISPDASVMTATSTASTTNNAVKSFSNLNKSQIKTKIDELRSVLIQLLMKLLVTLQQQLKAR